MMSGRSVSSAKFSGDVLNERNTGAGSSGVTANIFPPTLNSRSLPHWICSVVPGKERQSSRSQSTFMRRSLSQKPYPPQQKGLPELLARFWRQEAFLRWIQNREEPLAVAGPSPKQSITFRR